MEFLFKKIYFVQIVFFVLLPLCGFSQTSGSVKTLVVDAGHGGTDPGAVGKKSKEKDIALTVALKFGALVQQNFPDVRVIYTRKDDRDVELRERSKIANRNNADLFISIHCNSSENTSARGVETWLMGLHKSDLNLSVAKTENAAILKEQNYEKNYDGFDPNSPDAYIIFSMYQNAYLDQSISFAQKVQAQYSNILNTPNRGMFQAGFIVLWGCTMPSVLTEIGFISNLDEEKFLNSADGQEKIATSLLNAFREYKYQIEGFANISASTPSTPSTTTTPATTVTTATTTTTATPATTATSSTTIAPKTSISTSTNPTATTQTTASIPAETTATVDAKSATSAALIVFKVQFASSSINKNIDSPEFKNLPKVSKFSDKGVFKYCSGESASLQAAKELLQTIQAQGYRDAFVVAFKDGEKISMQEALKLTKR
ncbi:MAG: N-acetylmuramoyl-L-alanine amidase [Bacteroidales bacterium]|jgi:N-acetylmuramoyl-L-alanine amidase|nr:N-acetylmuramoyl-L-alanine amidase [Bacteroidales bacterium]